MLAAAASWRAVSRSSSSSFNSVALLLHCRGRQGRPLLHHLLSTAAFHRLSYASTGNPPDVIAYNEIMASSDEKNAVNITDVNLPPSSHLVSGLLERASMYEEKYGPLCKVWIGPDNPDPSMYYNDAGMGVKRMYQSITDTGELCRDERYEPTNDHV